GWSWRCLDAARKEHIVAKPSVRGEGLGMQRALQGAVGPWSLLIPAILWKKSNRVPKGAACNATSENQYHRRRECRGDNRPLVRGRRIGRHRAFGHSPNRGDAQRKSTRSHASISDC